MEASFLPGLLRSPARIMLVEHNPAPR